MNTNLYSTASPDIHNTGLAAAEHMLGEADAPVTLVEYGDYECDACAQAEPVAQHLFETFGSQMRYIYRHFPLVEMHPHAELAAEAAEAAAAQGKFWEMHHLLFSAPHHLKLSDLRKHAETIGLDMTRFDAEMGDRIYTQRIQEHRRAGAQTGLRATPAFFLNGKLVDVSFGYEKLEDAIEDLTAAAAKTNARRHA